MSKYVGGCDVGSASGKAVILKDDEIASFDIIPSTARTGETARIVMESAVNKAGLSSLKDLQYIVGTGYGRFKVSFADERVSEITCHARGAFRLCPTVRTVLDIGGQDCKVMALNDGQKVIEFILNEKCAAGTGKFFEAMARSLGTGLEGLSSLSLAGSNPCTITNQCSVFAESEVITLINEGAAPADIAAGIHVSIATRLASMLRRVGLVEDLALTGGCAKNKGLVKGLEAKLPLEIKKLPEDPQIAGALGAAVIGKEKVGSRSLKQVNAREG